MRWWTLKIGLATVRETLPLQGLAISKKDYLTQITFKRGCNRRSVQVRRQ